MTAAGTGILVQYAPSLERSPMNPGRSESSLLASLLGAGVMLYVLRWVLFPTAPSTTRCGASSSATSRFLFLQVAIVTLVIDRLLRNRERGR